MATDLDLADTRVVCRVNGEVRQDGTTADLVFDVPTLLSLHLPVDHPAADRRRARPGTPAGVGPIEPGDTVEVEVPGIGVTGQPRRGAADLTFTVTTGSPATHDRASGTPDPIGTTDGNLAQPALYEVTRDAGTDH